MLCKRGGQSRSGQTPRTPRPPPSPGHTTSSTSARSPSPPFGNVDSPPAAVRPPPSPPCSVYQSLSIVPVGALTLPGSHGPPASGLPAPRRRAHRAPSGRRRPPGGLPGRGGRGRRRIQPAEVRRARAREFLTCGVFEGGVARFQCEGCARQHLVPFSCNGRGWCPCRGGRRMTERAAHLVGALLPRGQNALGHCASVPRLPSALVSLLNRIDDPGLRRGDIATHPLDRARARVRHLAQRGPGSTGQRSGRPVSARPHPSSAGR